MKTKKFFMLLAAVAAQRALHQGKQVNACRLAEKRLESVCPSL